MGNIFKIEEYSFTEIKSNNHNRPFRVRCLETGEEKDSAISYEDAAWLIIGPNRFAKSIIDGHNQDEIYIREVFTEVLLGRKKSECDDLVKSEIVERGRIRGTIVSIQSQERFAEYKEYQTDYFIVKILFENGLQRRSTQVLIEKRNSNV